MIILCGCYAGFMGFARGCSGLACVLVTMAVGGFSDLFITARGLLYGGSDEFAWSVP